MVAATLTLRDGTESPGFITPADPEWDLPPKPHLRGISARYGGSPLALLGIHQPRIFLGAARFHFWGGRRGIPLEEKQSFYAALAKTPEQIFPMAFIAHPGLAGGIISGQVDGFFRLVRDAAPVIEL